MPDLSLDRYGVGFATDGSFAGGDAIIRASTEAWGAPAVVRAFEVIKSEAKRPTVWRLNERAGSVNWEAVWYRQPGEVSAEAAIDMAAIRFGVRKPDIRWSAVDGVGMIFGVDSGPPGVFVIAEYASGSNNGSIRYRVSGSITEIAELIHDDSAFDVAQLELNGVITDAGSSEAVVLPRWFTDRESMSSSVGEGFRTTYHLGSTLGQFIDLADHLGVMTPLRNFLRKGNLIRVSTPLGVGIEWCQTSRGPLMTGFTVGGQL